jgi:esterase/lipase
LSDGYKANYYTFNFGNQDSIDTYLFFITGSGHASVQYTRHYLKDLPGNVKVFTLQKRYVGHWTTGLFEPSKDFDKTYCISNLQRDQLEFVRYILAKENTQGKRVVVLGVSEGGVMAPAIAATIPEITHLVVLGTGGMKGLDSFKIWGQKQGIDFEDIYQKVKLGATDKKFLQYTYKWWLEMLKADPMKDLSRLDIPIFYGMGDKDDKVNTATLFYLRDEFIRLGKPNLTLQLYPDCNHILVDSKGNSHSKEFLHDISTWWSETAGTNINVRH